MKITSRAHGEEGAAAVEFALIVGVLALLIFGMLQFGLAFFQLQNLRAATREGARIGAVDGTVADIRARVQSASGLSAPLGSSVYVKSRHRRLGDHRLEPDDAAVRHRERNQHPIR